MVDRAQERRSVGGQDRAAVEQLPSARRLRRQSPAKAKGSPEARPRRKAAMGPTCLLPLVEPQLPGSGSGPCGSVAEHRLLGRGLGPGVDLRPGSLASFIHAPSRPQRAKPASGLPSPMARTMTICRSGVTFQLAVSPSGGSQPKASVNWPGRSRARSDRTWSDLPAPANIGQDLGRELPGRPVRAHAAPITAASDPAPPPGASDDCHVGIGGIARSTGDPLHAGRKWCVKPDPQERDPGRRATASIWASARLAIDPIGNRRWPVADADRGTRGDGQQHPGRNVRRIGLGRQTIGRARGRTRRLADHVAAQDRPHPAWGPTPGRGAAATLVLPVPEPPPMASRQCGRRCQKARRESEIALASAAFRPVRALAARAKAQDLGADHRAQRRGTAAGVPAPA